MFAQSRLSSYVLQRNSMIEDLRGISDELTTRITGARESIAEAALEGNWERAQSITAAVKQLEEISTKVERLKKDIRRAISEFDSATRTHTKSRHTKLLISIHWSMAGEERSDELIDDDQAADALGHFIEAVVGVYGEGILESLARIPNGSSGLVSRQPNQDFRNPTTGDSYSNRRITGTGWSVKTHSSTAQKAEQIHQIKSALGMPRHSVDVDVVEK